MVSATATMRVSYSYLDREFADVEPYLDDLRDLARSGDFTLGKAVSEFEGRVISFTGLPFAVGMANGTDALELALRAAGIGHNDYVMVPANTFVATAGAAVMAGATPLFVDVTDDFTMDPDSLERALRKSSRAVMPVHLTGQIADMPRIMEIAERHNLVVIEDAAQAMGATLDGQHAGSWGASAGISMHPLKMLNVWGDGGLTLTRDPVVAEKLRLLRNHGLETRDDAVCFGTNGRLSSLQAVIANRVIQGLPRAIARRREIATILTTEFDTLNDDGLLRTPITRPGVAPVWMTYIVRVPNDCRTLRASVAGQAGATRYTTVRDALKAYLLERGIDVKIHYPVPLHLQTVGRRLGYREGMCPVAERHAREILTLPCHEYLTDDEIYYMTETVKGFFR